MNLTLRLHQTSFSANKKENMDKMFRLIEESDACIDVFPEYSMGIPPTGLTEKFVYKNAETIDGEFIQKMIEKTVERGSAIVFSAYLEEGAKVYNAAILAEKGKIKTIYRKIHLFNAFGYRESEVFAQGRELAIADFKGFKIGLAVCFDLRFPELFRIMAQRGVNVFIVPSAWYKGKHKISQWQALTLTRSHENNAYLIAVDQTHPFFIGHSIATSPLGYVIKEVKEEQTSFTVNMEYQAIEESIHSLPIMTLSKPLLYKRYYQQ